MRLVWLILHLTIVVDELKVDFVILIPILLCLDIFCQFANSRFSIIYLAHVYVQRPELCFINGILFW